MVRPTCLALGRSVPLRIGSTTSTSARRRSTAVPAKSSAISSRRWCLACSPEGDNTWTSISDEQTALKDSLAKFISRDYTFDDRWKIIKSPEGWSRTRWNQLAEIGLMALPVAEADGGLGGKVWTRCW